MYGFYVRRYNTTELINWYHGAIVSGIELGDEGIVYPIYRVRGKEQ